jgi:uncharacterized protein (TIGR02611 family)
MYCAFWEKTSVYTKTRAVRYYVGMHKPIKLLRKLLVLLIGIPVFVLGIILIPLPGPGLLVCLLALMILSYEFDSAKKYRDKVLKKVRSIIAATKAKTEKADE